MPSSPMRRTADRTTLLDADDPFLRREAVRHFLEYQRSDVPARPPRRFGGVEADDLAQEPLREPDVVMGKQVGARLGQLEQVPRPPGVPSHLRDGDVVVALEDIEVATHRSAGKAELGGQILDPDAFAPAEDGEDLLAGAVNVCVHAARLASFMSFRSAIRAELAIPLRGMRRPMINA